MCRIRFWQLSSWSFPRDVPAINLAPAALFPSGVRTVHIPVVQNETFRHDLGVRLTEALVREVEQRTPYKVVSNPNADTVLRCNITGESKDVLSETENDDPRALDASVPLPRRGRLEMARV